MRYIATAKRVYDEMAASLCSVGMSWKRMQHIATAKRAWGDLAGSLGSVGTEVEITDRRIRKAKKKMTNVPRL